jgi:hypothetical protein
MYANQAVDDMSQRLDKLEAELKDGDKKDNSTASKTQ